MRKLLPLLISAATIVTSSHAQVSIVSDMIPGTMGSNPAFLTSFNSKLYFNTKDTTHGRELWMYNGLAAPSMVSDLNPGIYDGTFMGYDVSSSYVVIGSDMYMAADNGTTGGELYKYSGSGAPALVSDIDTGSGSSAPLSLVAYSGKLYFMATTPAWGYELYRYDPQTLATTRLSDINTGAASSLKNDYQQNDIIPFQGRLYFAATDGVKGYELYAYNPANDSVTLVADINTGSGNADPAGFLATAGTLYFTANDGTHGNELFAYTGSGAPAMITDLNPGSGAGSAAFPPVLFNNQVVFTGNNGATGLEMFALTPGTSTPTLVKDIKQGTGDGAPEYYAINGNKLFFSAFDAQHGNELWAWDGSNTPYLVSDINTGSANSDPACMLSWNNKLYMNAQMSSTGYELYVFNDSTLGIENAQQNLQLSVYPVPATAQINIAVSLDRTEDIALSLTDVSGKYVYNSSKQLQQGKNVITIDSRSFAAGVYFYHLYEKNGTLLATGRVVKQ